jgi:hypothetical protein
MTQQCTATEHCGARHKASHKHSDYRLYRQIQHHEIEHYLGHSTGIDQRPARGKKCRSFYGSWGFRRKRDSHLSRCTDRSVERVDVADLATPEAFQSDEELAWGWYEWRSIQVLRAQPNPAHLAIAALARHVPKMTVITQNVDDLHERSGSVGVLHLHGGPHHPRCSVCGSAHTLPDGIPKESDGGRRLCPPRCHLCGKSVRLGWSGLAKTCPSKS